MRRGGSGSLEFLLRGGRARARGGESGSALCQRARLGGEPLYRQGDYSDEQGETHRFTLRHIHIWNRSSDRRTCALVHADGEVLSLEEATDAILSRWGASENTFKHLQERHPAHYQPGFKLVESERQDIANPDIKPLEKPWSGARRFRPTTSASRSPSWSSSQTVSTAWVCVPVPVPAMSFLRRCCRACEAHRII